MRRAPLVLLCLAPLCLVMPWGSVATARPMASVYTDTVVKCRDLRDKGADSSGRVWRCEGPAGYAAVFSDEGNVVEVELGRSGEEKNLGGLQWAGGDGAIGPKVEWRMRGRAPIAAILRIVDRDENGGRRPRLLVAKVGAEGGCLIGFVDVRSPSANVEARRLADRRAASFRCDKGQDAK